MLDERAAPGEEHGALVEVDPEYEFERAERGLPELAMFERAAWRAQGVEPAWPVVASFRCATAASRASASCWTRGSRRSRGCGGWEVIHRGHRWAQIE